jgi:hypothetical protein
MTDARLSPDIMLHITATHEGGHAAVAVALGLRFRTVSIISNKKKNSLGAIHGTQKFWHELPSPHLIKVAEANILMDFAGEIAQRRFALQSDWRGGAETDRHNAEGGALLAVRCARRPRRPDSKLPGSQNGQPPSPQISRPGRETC